MLNILDASKLTSNELISRLKHKKSPANCEAYIIR